MNLTSGHDFFGKHMFRHPSSSQADTRIFKTALNCNPWFELDTQDTLNYALLRNYAQFTQLCAVHDIQMQALLRFFWSVGHNFYRFAVCLGIVFVYFLCSWERELELVAICLISLSIGNPWHAEFQPGFFQSQKPKSPEFTKIFQYNENDSRRVFKQS